MYISTLDPSFRFTYFRKYLRKMLQKFKVSISPDLKTGFVHNSCDKMKVNIKRRNLKRNETKKKNCCK